MDKGEFIKDGFTVLPTANGGWVVIRVDDERYCFRDSHASFTNFEEMIFWLEKENVARILGAVKTDDPSDKAPK